MVVLAERKVAVCLPALNELPNLEALLPEIADVAREELQRPVTVYVFDDGSTDGTFESLRTQDFPGVTVIAVRSSINLGKASAIHHLLAKAVEDKAEFILMMDADGQDDPKYIFDMVDVLASGADVVNGRRVNRAHSRSKRFSSRLFNATVRTLTGLKVLDINSGFKGFSREAAKILLPYFYGELHRAILIIALWIGLIIDEVKITNRPRLFGKSKYGFARGWRGLADLVTIQFLRKYSSSPGHFFSGIGMSFIAFGTVLLGLGIWISVTGVPESLWAYTPWAGLSSIAFGFVFISLGFIAELVLFLSKGPISAVVQTHPSQK